jgi:GNAT superfamily N-acetyltransferase
MSAVTIRMARPADLPSIDPIDASAAETFTRFGQPLPDGSAPAPEGHWAGVQAAGLLWIADDAEAGPVGFLASKRVEGALYVEQVSVVMQRQQQGLGRRLMLAAIDWARGERLAAVTLTTFRDIPWNAPFYASLGFIEPPDNAMPAHLAARLADEAKNGFTDRCAMWLDL